MTVLGVDFETRSAADLKRQGLYVYAEHPTTDVLCLAYAFGDEEPQLWVPDSDWGLPAPRFYQHIEAGGAMRAWNAAFERTIWYKILGPRYGFPIPKLEQWYCTAAEARAMNLPRALWAAAKVLGVPEQKEKRGAELIKLLCVPDKKTGEFNEDPALLQELYDYCQQDVRTERAVAAKVRRLSAFERQVFLMDQRANDRGVRLDVPLVEAAHTIVVQATKEANAELTKITDGAVTKVTQIQRIREWAGTQGVELDDLRKHTVKDALYGEGTLPAVVERVLTLRYEVGKTSASKLQAMLRSMCADQYARGTLLYHGAGTGRWAGMLLQPQNFPRGDVKDPERYLDDIMLAAQMGEWVYPDPAALAVVTSLLRGMLIPSEGHVFRAGDYSQIEARVLGWLAGEPYGDLEYEKMAAAIFNVPVEEIVAEHAAGNSERRKMGKDTVLGCGYQMGWERYIEQAWERSNTVVAEALARRSVYTFRDLKPGIPQYWRDAQQAAMQAVREPGVVAHVGVGAITKFVVRGQFLWCVLPSGRPLAYALPRVSLKETKWGMRETLTYAGTHPESGRWVRRSTYGGSLTENIASGTARDIMASAMLRLDQAGHRPILSVHDEVICDTPLDHSTLEEFQGLLEVVPSWATGCPIATECWEGPRYKKG